jgi:hypothetical protein
VAFVTISVLDKYRAIEQGKLAPEEKKKAIADLLHEAQASLAANLKKFSADVDSAESGAQKEISTLERGVKEIQQESHNRRKQLAAKPSSLMKPSKVSKAAWTPKQMPTLEGACNRISKLSETITARVAEYRTATAPLTEAWPAVAAKMASAGRANSKIIMGLLAEIGLSDALLKRADKVAKALVAGEAHADDLLKDLRKDLHRDAQKQGEATSRKTDDEADAAADELKQRCEKAAAELGKGSAVVKDILKAASTKAPTAAQVAECDKKLDVFEGSIEKAEAELADLEERQKRFVLVLTTNCPKSISAIKPSAAAIKALAADCKEQSKLAKRCQESVKEMRQRIK